MENSFINTYSLKDYLTKVFEKMAIGLVITAVVAYISKTIIFAIGSAYYIVMIALAIAQVVVCSILTRRLEKMSVTAANTWFYVYSVLTGISFSYIGICYGAYNVFLAFIYTSIIFISCAVIGKYTSMDLSKIKTILFAGLIAIIIINLVNIFLRLDGMDLLVCYLGVLLFSGLTAYDVQKASTLYQAYSYDDQMVQKAAIYSALELYLDFINLFLYILRLLSRRRD